MDVRNGGESDNLVDARTSRMYYLSMFIFILN